MGLLSRQRIPFVVALTFGVRAVLATRIGRGRDATRSAGRAAGGVDVRAGRVRGAGADPLLITCGWRSDTWAGDRYTRRR